MRILLTGANGQLGQELVRALEAGHELIPATRDGLLQGKPGAMVADLGDAAALEALVETVRPQVVINAAAYTAVDRAEDDAQTAFAVNRDAAAALARACARVGCRFIHFSTDYVFDGEGAVPYREDDPTSPLGVYGASKLEGEHAVRDSGADAVVLRTAWVYAPHGANFLRTMLRVGAERPELRVVSDQFGCPTPTWLIADATVAMLARPELAGVFHVVARGRTSWHGFAQAIFEEALARGLLASAPRVAAISTEEYPTPARRPRFSVLDTNRLESALGIQLPEWRAALAETFDRAGALRRPV